MNAANEISASKPSVIVICTSYHWFVIVICTGYHWFVIVICTGYYWFVIVFYTGYHWLVIVICTGYHWLVIVICTGFHWLVGVTSRLLLYCNTRVGNSVYCMFSSKIKIIELFDIYSNDASSNIIAFHS